MPSVIIHSYKSSRYYASFEVNGGGLHPFDTVIFNKALLGMKYNPKHEIV